MPQGEDEERRLHQLWVEWVRRRRGGDLDDCVPQGVPQRGGKQGRPSTPASHTLRPRTLQRAQRGAIRAIQDREDPLQPSPGNSRRPVLGPRPRSLRGGASPTILKRPYR